MSEFVLITPVKNEESFISRVLDTIVNQEKKPIRWIIVDDNSIDNTANIIKNFCSNYYFIKYTKLEESSKRDFASKVNAIKYGVTKLTTGNYNYIGILDADITLESNYYSTLLNELDNEPKVGIAGGKIIDLVDGKKYPNPASPYSIKGAIQLFRKECYEDIGAFLPLKYGGEDAIACYMARFNGWQLKHYENLTVYHHRFNSTANKNLFQIQFEFGQREYHMGYLPLFSFMKSIGFIFKKPFLIGSIVKLIAYWYSKLRKERIIVPENVVLFLRQEQKKRLKKFF